MYCTEPFRIPTAGKLDVLCFDKTGTLTKDRLVLRGIASPQEKIQVFPSRQHQGGGPPSPAIQQQEAVTEVLEASSSSDLLLCVMGGCHDLMGGEGGQVLGDPLEVATFGEGGFHFAAAGSILRNNSRGIDMLVKRRFAFNSSVKRMSVEVEVVDHFSKERVAFVFCKGAPEVLADLLAETPPHYRATYHHHMSRGKRVLAVAFKQIPLASSNSHHQSDRRHVELGLHFAGFLVFECELKVDSKSVMKELCTSGHRVVMITGDSVYTAVDVARKLSMLSSEATVPLVLQVGLGGELVWRRVDETAGEGEGHVDDISFSLGTVSQLREGHDLCITGAALTVRSIHQVL